MSADLDLALLIGAVMLLISVAAVRWSTRLGVPSLLIYLAFGVLLGESFLGIRFDDAQLTRVLGSCALVLIIAEGGLTARWTQLRPVLGLASALSTVGVGVSIAVVALAAHLLLDLPWQEAALIGAILSSTDAAAVFSTLRRLRLRPQLVATLEAESGMNDAPVVILVVLLSTTDGLLAPWWGELLLVSYELVAGAVIGWLVGLAGVWLLRRAALPAAGLYPLAAIGLTVLAYAGGSVAHSSGFLAVYVTGVVLGNARLPHRQAILGFADGLAWLSQIGLFILLGLLVSPSGLLDALVPALVVGLVLLLVARPLSVLVCATPFRLSWPEQAFLSWAGLRGAVPIVLATIPLAAGVPGAEVLFNIVFVLVVVFTMIQSSTLPAVARRLGVTALTETTELRVETAPLESMRADLLQLEVVPGSNLTGVHLDELRLPVGAAVTLVLRNGTGFVPERSTRLRTGDSLLIVATDQVRDQAEARLRAVSRRGRLARWFGEEGQESTE